MATVGSALLNPETGWIRYDDKGSNIKYSGIGTSNSLNGSVYSASTSSYNSVINTTWISFTFYGTKLRLISQISSSGHSNNKINIDGIDYTFSENGSTIIYQALCFEKLGLTNTMHSVIITSGNTNAFMWFDAIDIDSTGYLVSGIAKYLLQNETNDLFTINGGLVKLGTQTTTEALYKASGFSDVTLLNGTIFNQVKTLVSEGILETGKVFSLDIDINMIKDINIT